MFFIINSIHIWSHLDSLDEYMDSIFYTIIAFYRLLL